LDAKVSVWLAGRWVSSAPRCDRVGERPA
jgi:hypothetical protein